MAIIRSPNTTGATSNTTLSGNISLEHGTNELVSYTSTSGEKMIAYKIDVAGIHYYDENGVEISRYAPDGIHYFNDSGTEIAKIDSNGMTFYDPSGVAITKIGSVGTQYFDNSGTKIAQIDATGTHYYNASGTEITKISTSGFEYYDDSSVKRITIGASSAGRMRMLFYDADGKARTIVGQNPSGGDQVVATSIAGHDVETELSA